MLKLTNNSPCPIYILKDGYSLKAERYKEIKPPYFIGAPSLFLSVVGDDTVKFIKHHEYRISSLGSRHIHTSYSILKNGLEYKFDSQGKFSGV